MNALSHEFDLSQATMLAPDAARAPLEASWEALHQAADAVALLAQLGREIPAPAVATLPERAHAAGGLRRELVERGNADLSAVMRAGLRALLAASEEGRDTTAAALTLWREFHAARDAILALVEPEPAAK